jgi:integrase
MSRPPLPLGTWGKIRTIEPQVGERAAWRAIANYRGYDGHTKSVERSGPTGPKAINNLREALQALADQSTSGSLTISSRFAEAAATWLTKIRKRRAGTTYDRYRSRLHQHILPALGELTLGECTVGRLEDFLDDLGVDKHLKANTLAGIRTVLSGVMQVAVRHGVFRHNPVRELESIEDNGAKRRKATFTQSQLVDFLRKLDADKRAVRADLPDLLRFIFGTGVRFGEGLAVRWRDVNLTGQPMFVEDQEIPPHSVWINGNIVAITGLGLVRHEGKTAKANRVIGIPAYLVTLLRVRRPADALDEDPVFPSAVGTWRAPSGVQRAVRAMRVRIDYPEFTTHVGRRTVATLLDHAGQSARKIADQLGHANPSMTQDLYMGRGMANPEAASLLEQAHVKAVA